MCVLANHQAGSAAVFAIADISINMSGCQDDAALCAVCCVLPCNPAAQGIGKTLNPSYNFSEFATPYAQELLQIQDGQQQGFIIEQLQQQATEVTQAAAAMPLRVRRIDNTLEQLEAGDLKLR